MTTDSLATPTRNRPQHLLHLACHVLGAGQGGIAFLSPDGTPREHLLWGVSDERVSEYLCSPWIIDLLGHVLGNSSPVRFSEDALPASQHLPPSEWSPGSFLATILERSGPAQAVFYLFRRQGQPSFTEHDQHLLTLFAISLEQGNLGEEARLVSQLGLLNRLTQAAAGNLQLKPLLQAALRELDRYLPRHASGVWLSVMDNGSHSPTTTPPPTAVLLVHSGAAERLDPLSRALTIGWRLAVAETPFQECLTEGRAMYSDWTRPEEQSSPLVARLVAEGATSGFAVPLRAGDRIHGVLQSVSSRRGGFTSEQIQMLYLVADLLGPALSNCQLFGRLQDAYDELSRTQEQLVRAEKMRAVGELASGVAHEFNNSLCGILGFLELALLDRGLANQHQGYLDAARRCALEAASVVRRVQDFSCRREEPSTRWIDLNEQVRRDLDQVRHKWETANLRGGRIVVDVRLEAQAGLRGDPEGLREVLTNLVFNAVEAMPHEGTLTVRTWSDPDRVFLSVADTGVGLSEEAERRLFEPFFTTKGVRGSGLGLSRTFAIVQRHGGEVRVESRPGSGTTFVAQFPAVPAPERTTPLPPTGPARRTTESTSLDILVVEDDETVRRFLDLGLKRLGHRVRLTEDVRSGLEALRGGCFDVVLTDLGLPDGNGEDIIRAVRTETPGTPVLVLTGWADLLPEPPEGVVRMLGKPVTLEVLKQALAEARASVTSAQDSGEPGATSGATREKDDELAGVGRT